MTDLFFAASADRRQKALLTWWDSFDAGVILPDYHRMQLEHWLWRELKGKDYLTFDIGQHDAPRVWLDMPRYRTLGFVRSDVVADLREIPLRGVECFICTEVLEHCADPGKACHEMFEALAPGGVLYGAAPFCWPDHHTDAYPDYWRFTEQAWELMLDEFEEIDINPMLWTEEGEQLWNFMRRFECMGYESLVMNYTGYMVKAKKAA